MTTSLTDRVRERHERRMAAHEWRVVALARGEPVGEELHRRLRDRVEQAAPLACHVRRHALRHREDPTR
jgi:hypothetical protein